MLQHSQSQGSSRPSSLSGDACTGTSQFLCLCSPRSHHPSPQLLCDKITFILRSWHKTPFPLRPPLACCQSYSSISLHLSPLLHLPFSRIFPPSPLFLSLDTGTDTNTYTCGAALGKSAGAPGEEYQETMKYEKPKILMFLPANFHRTCYAPSNQQRAGSDGRSIPADKHHLSL